MVTSLHPLKGIFYLPSLLSLLTDKDRYGHNPVYPPGDILSTIYCLCLQIKIVMVTFLEPLLGMFYLPSIVSAYR